MMMVPVITMAIGKRAELCPQCGYLPNEQPHWHRQLGQDRHDIRVYLLNGTRR